MFTNFKKTDLEEFFKIKPREVRKNKLYEEMFIDEKAKDFESTVKFMKHGTVPTDLEEETHKATYYWNSAYNDYLIKNYPDEAMYRRFGRIALMMYATNGMLKKRVIRLKRRFATYDLA